MTIADQINEQVKTLRDEVKNLADSIKKLNVDDLRAMHGMARIRHGYMQIAPIIAPYFTSATNDDIDSVLTGYGSPAGSGFGIFVYGLTTSGGMIGLIVSMVGGVLAAVLGLLIGVSGTVAVWVGVVGAIVVFAIIAALTIGSVPRHQADLTVLFPAAAPADVEPPD